MKVRVHIDCESGSWRAVSPDVKGMNLFASSRKDLENLIETGVPFYLEREDVEVILIDRTQSKV
ncbi:unannotated protein [freshwater metagenome]|jgi:hypothetical protein|uniref:Unannotated protein n=1 Tax=freshwater metagenome TaxID=449393 RepID=A0A6J7QI64_9ZZZZ|nr:hypothetical protein [Actinomycetota bacterium]MSW75435.1 hypothetical protein [Actinomycetota bacterium]